MTSIVVDEPVVEEEIVEEVEEVEVEEAEPEVELPKKFQGKSLEDIVKSYTELERELGRKANEVGDLRKLTDDYLRRELSRTESPTHVDEDEEVDIFNTKEKVRKEIENDPRIKSLEEKLANKERKEALDAFSAKHPDYQQIGKSEEFQEWVNKSQYRIKMFQQADAMDLEAADDLLTMWKDVTKHKATSEANEGLKEKRKQDLKKVSGESSSTGSGKRKTYSRVELMRLRINDPEKYNSMQEEIMSAYKEGRVK